MSTRSARRRRYNERREIALANPRPPRRRNRQPASYVYNTYNPPLENPPLEEIEPDFAEFLQPLPAEVNPPNPYREIGQRVQAHFRKTGVSAIGRIKDFYRSHASDKWRSRKALVDKFNSQNLALRRKIRENHLLINTIEKCTSKPVGYTRATKEEHRRKYRDLKLGKLQYPNKIDYIEEPYRYFV
jgi:hypothetical protein